MEEDAPKKVEKVGTTYLTRAGNITPGQTDIWRPRYVSNPVRMSVKHLFLDPTLGFLPESMLLVIPNRRREMTHL